MNKCLSPKTAMKRAAVVLIAACCCASAAQAQAGPAINGVYNGTYMCRMERNVKLSLFATPNGVLTGLFTFYPSPGAASTFSLNGTYDAATQKFTLQPSKWETSEPSGFAMVGMEGTYNPGGSQISGKIIFSGCYGFQATKDAAASANVGAVMAQQRAGTASAQAVPPTPSAPPAAATPTRPTQAASAAAPAAPVPAAAAVPNRPAASPTSRAVQSSAPTAAPQTTSAARVPAPSKGAPAAAGTPVASSLDYLPSANSNPPSSNPPGVKTDMDVEMSLPANLRRLKVTTYFSMTPQQQTDALMTIVRAYGGANLYNTMVMPQYTNPPQPALQELKAELERARKNKIPDLIDVESRIRMDYNTKAWEIALKNPNDTRWINTLVQVQESILVRGLVTGDFSEMQGNRVGALNYIRGFNDDLGLGGFDPLADSDDPGGDCPDLYDEALSNAAAAEIPTPTAGDLLAGVARMAQGDFFGAEDLGYQIEQLKTLYNNGGQDANTMANVQFDGCEGSLLLKMVANAKAFVRAKPQAAPAQTPAPAVAAPRSSQPSSSGTSPRYSK